MKQLIILSALFILFSCSRSSNDSGVNNLSKYYGIYNSTSGDTTEITQGNGNYTVFRWAFKNLGTRYVFDSVLIGEDGSFVDNERAMRISNGTSVISYVSSVGSGQFATNSVSFHFIANGSAQVIFNGVKK